MTFLSKQVDPWKTKQNKAEQRIDNYNKTKSRRDNVPWPNCRLDSTYT